MLAARNFPEWYAFFGGEEMYVSRDDAAKIWLAATKAAEARQTQTNSASDAIPLPIIRKIFDEIVDCRQDVIDNFIDALVRAAKQHALP